MTKVLVTGATGFIGSHLTDELLKKGYSVKCTVRKTSNLRWLKNKNVELIYSDMFNEEALKDALKDVDYIYHSAGVTFAKKKEDYFSGNVKATENLLEICYKVKPGLKRFIFVSSQTVAGPSMTEIPVDENYECHPITTYGRSKLEAEKSVMKYFDKMNCTIVRPPAVYGPRDTAIFEYFKTMNNRIQPLIGFGNKLVSLIYVSDLVKGIILAGENSNSVSKIYFISSEKFYRWREVGSVTSAVMNKKTFRIVIPHFLVYIVGAFAQFFSLFSSKPAILNLEKCRDITRKYWTCSAEKAKEELGFREEVTLEEGIEKTVEWYRENKWLK